MMSRVRECKVLRARNCQLTALVAIESEAIHERRSNCSFPWLLQFLSLKKRRPENPDSVIFIWIGPISPFNKLNCVCVCVLSFFFYSSWQLLLLKLYSLLICGLQRQSEVMMTWDISENLPQSSKNRKIPQSPYIMVCLRKERIVCHLT